ncbi:DUF6011 domain-containing protein [Streptomyces sp. NPDC005900]|uniref:DUF6011 domain-containing protein n=1 Tax=Streptomyces sp. NPDC005900 TaxID=3154569 RepID=UPI0033CAE202
MAHQQQEALTETPSGLPRRRWCRRCRRELKDPASRLLGLGPDCDPNQRSKLRDHHVAQDPIPGT